MKKLVLKYSIEFFVIVFSISVSFFVENLREKNEKDALRVLIKQSLLEELEINVPRLETTRQDLETWNKHINYFLRHPDSLDNALITDFLKENNYSPLNVYMTVYTPDLPNATYNALVNDGSLNLIKDPALKSSIEQLYNRSSSLVNSWVEEEKNVATRAENYFVEKYPGIYLKDFWKRYYNLDLFNQAINVMKSDNRFKATMMQKESFMIAKLRDFNLYLSRRDSLINTLKESLASN